MEGMTESGQMAISSFLSEREHMSPLQILRMLFSYPYCNLISQFYLRTREYEAGLLFVDRSRDLLDQYGPEIPQEEFQQIERDISFLELSLYDALNLWQEYLDLFEQIFREKRNKAYLLEYVVDAFGGQSPEERFGRYLMSASENIVPSSSAFALSTEAEEQGQQIVFVHQCYLHDHRRAIIARKLRRQQEGKNVEHLKRHQKEKLSVKEQDERFAEMATLFEYMKKSSHSKEN